MMKRSLRLLACATLATLAACGGGGGDPGDNTNYNARAAWNNFLAPAGPRAWSAVGIANDGNTYELRLGAAPVANGRFPLTNLPANRIDVSASIRRGGAVLGSSVTELYYDNGLLVLGSRDGSGGVTCSVSTSAAVPPAAAKAANGGPLYRADDLDGCTSSATATGRTVADWSVAVDRGIRYFCINSSFTDLAGAVLGTESDCVEIDAAGNLGNRARISVSVAGGLSITAYTP